MRTVSRAIAMGVTLVALAMSLSGCKTIKPWEKEYLLSPLMDDAALSQLGSPFRGAALGSFEKLASAGGGGGGAACPTCGG
jgi:hypothetical protein